MNTTTSPREIVAAVTDSPVLPRGDDERFVGFGVMGLPFRSGHYLAYRQFPATTFAPGYLSVWHRDPAGTWTFYATTPGPQSCARYFSSATANDAVRCDIDVTWTGPWSLSIAMPGLLEWTVDIAPTPATRALTAIGRRLPEAAWTHRAVLGVVSRVAGTALGTGPIRLAGTAANGQRYMVAPRRVWVVASSRATLRGEDLGPVGPLAEQAVLGDFRLPQRGVCVAGTGHFETFDPDRHIAVAGTAFR